MLDWKTSVSNLDMENKAKIAHVVKMREKTKWKVWLLKKARCNLELFLFSYFQPKRKPWEKSHQKKKIGGNKKKTKTQKKNTTTATPSTPSEETVKEKHDNSENLKKIENDEVGFCLIFNL